MKTYARNIGNSAIDVTTTDNVADLFHEDVATQFVEVPAGTVNGATFDGTKWTNPAPAIVVVTLAPLTPMTFYLAFSTAERIALKSSTDPIVAEFWDTYQRAERTNTMIDPNLVSVREGLQYIATPKPGGPGILASADRIDEILAGTPQ